MLPLSRRKNRFKNFITCINFLLYITTLSDFRRLYKQLFSDLNIIKLNEEDSDMNTPTEQTLYRYYLQKLNTELRNLGQCEDTARAS